MKKLLFFISLLFFFILPAMSQTVGHLRYDSLKIYKVGGNAELILENATRNVTNSFLQNTGNGRTGFAVPNYVDSVEAVGDSIFFWNKTLGTKLGAAKAGSVTAENGVRVEAGVVKLSNYTTGYLLTDDVFVEGITNNKEYSFSVQDFFVNVERVIRFQGNAAGAHDSTKLAMQDIGLQYSGAYALDGDATLGKKYTVLYLPTIAANRTLTIPYRDASEAGIVQYILNENSSGFNWNLAGAPMVDGLGNTLTSIDRGLWLFIWNGANWVRQNASGSATPTLDQVLAAGSVLAANREIDLDAYSLAIKTASDGTITYGSESYSGDPSMRATGLFTLFSGSNYYIQQVNGTDADAADQFPKYQFSLYRPTGFSTSANYSGAIEGFAYSGDIGTPPTAANNNKPLMIVTTGFNNLSAGDIILRPGVQQTASYSTRFGNYNIKLEPSGTGAVIMPYKAGSSLDSIMVWHEPDSSLRMVDAASFASGIGLMENVYFENGTYTANVLDTLLTAPDDSTLLIKSVGVVNSTFLSRVRDVDALSVKYTLGLDTANAALKAYIAANSAVPNIQQVLDAGSTLSTSETLLMGANTFSFSGSSLPLYSLTTAGSEAARFSSRPASTNTVIPILQLYRETTGTAATGIGGAIWIGLEKDNGAIQADAVEMKAHFTNATDAGRTANFDFVLANAGGEQTAMNIQPDGIVRVNGNTDTLATMDYARSVGIGANERFSWDIYEEFLGQTATQTIFLANTGNAGTTGVSNPNDVTEWGIYAISVTGGTSSLAGMTTGGNITFNSTYDYVFEAVITNISALNDGTNDCEINVGFYDNADTGADPVDGAMFRYDVGNTQWQCVTISNSVSTGTVTNSGTTVTTGGITLRVEGSSTEVRYYINGSLVATHTSNIPAALGRYFGAGARMNKRTGTGTMSFEIDKFKYRRDAL